MLQTCQASSSSLCNKPEYAHRLQGNVFFVTCGDGCDQITSNGSQEVVALKSTHQEADSGMYLHYDNMDIGCWHVKDQSCHGNQIAIFYCFQLVQKIMKIINTHNTLLK